MRCYSRSPAHRRVIGCLAVSSVAQHYAGYDIEDWHGNERYGYNAIISMQDLAETYLPSFKSCLKDAHVGSAMCSYNVSSAQQQQQQQRNSSHHTYQPLTH